MAQGTVIGVAGTVIGVALCVLLALNLDVLEVSFRNHERWQIVDQTLHRIWLKTCRA